MNRTLFPIHKYFVFNDRLQPVSTFVPSENEGGIYEVLRVVNGIPLFLDEHLQRFQHSAALAEKEISYSCTQIEAFLQQLILKNEVKEGNILISCKTNLKAFFITHNYPSDEQYKRGICCGLLHAERMNPNAKVFQTEVRKQANRLIESKGFYEVLLVDHEQRVTEGSRSNVFFIKGDEIITPPGKHVLLGITRQKIIACTHRLNLKVKESEVHLDGLTDFDAAFITGTSPKILPIKEVDEHCFDAQNKVLRRVMNEYDKMFEKDIKKRLSGKADN
ncbi:aminotransferase class IV [Draconibacterium halophilum]|uniref:branched-chain-amino-acid transaminase n=1 Tax=Draconibacterium halophilum TaxID=2706887 RepID=A0A6C0RGH2_9BACT|nr:aminotransferase class IV [Draconibacterium halophilum]QIA08623.1 aminotransferase class IV [Draconibacterium halophilum]